MLTISKSAQITVMSIPYIVLKINIEMWNTSKCIYFCLYKYRKTLAEEQRLHKDEIIILLKIGEHFVQKQHIQSLARFGKGTKMILTNGREYAVHVPFDKVEELIEAK
jgi:hypothetical protein